MHDVHPGRSRRVCPRRWSVEPGHRVVHIPAGAFDLPKEALADEVDAFADGVAAHIEADGGVDVVHANYWLSGVVGHRLKHELDVPLVVDVPHARPGEGRGRRPRAGVARPRRGRGDRVQRRDLRQLPAGGTPVPPAVRRPAAAHRDRRRRRRARVLRPGRPRRRASRRSGCRPTVRCCCSSGGSSR